MSYSQQTYSNIDNSLLGEVHLITVHVEDPSTGCHENDLQRFEDHETHMLPGGFESPVVVVDIETVE